MLRPEDRLTATGNYPPGLDSTDGFLMSLCDGKATVGQVMTMTPVSADETRTRLAKLMQLGAVKLDSLDAEAQSYFRQLSMFEKLAAMNDYYKLLGLSKTATTPQVKAAFLKLSLKFHPDKIPKTLRLDDKARERSETLYGLLQKAHDTLISPERRKAYAMQRLKQQQGVQLEEKENATDSGKHIQEGVRIGTLLTLAEESVKRGEYRSAANNLALARQIDPRNPKVTRLSDVVESTSKMHALLEKVDAAGSLAPTEVKKIELAISQHKQAFDINRKLLSLCFRVAVRNNLSKEITAELFQRLASGKMSDIEYQLGVDFFDQHRLFTTALETAERGATEYPASAELKKRVKELRKKNL